MQDPQDVQKGGEKDGICVPATPRSPLKSGNSDENNR